MPCAGLWDSFIGGLIGGKEDGQIDVKVDAAGKITGKHILTNKPIDGQCTPGQFLHVIKFTRTDDNGCTFTYQGIVGQITRVKHLPSVPAFAAILGRVHIECPTAAAIDDDWIGTHTT
jgi:hypothetical protein